MSTERDALFQGVEGAGGPSQADMEDTSVSDVSDMPTACHSGVQVEQQTDSQAVSYTHLTLPTICSV